MDPGPWVVTEEEQHQFFNLFNQMDGSKKGFLYIEELESTMFITGLPKYLTKHIINLCDVGNNRKLTKEEFALAMPIVWDKLTGKGDPPDQLLANMIPPTALPTVEIFLVPAVPDGDRVAAGEARAARPSQPWSLEYRTINWWTWRPTIRRTIPLRLRSGLLLQQNCR